MSRVSVCLIASILCLFTSRPTVGLNWNGEKQQNPLTTPISFIGTVAVTSTLLVSPALASNNDDAWFLKQQGHQASTTSSRARFVRNTQALQDNRLSQCAPKGKNWEQCYFYGTGTDGIDPTPGGKFLSAPPKKEVKQGVPTW